MHPLRRTSSKDLFRGLLCIKLSSGLRHVGVRQSHPCRVSEPPPLHHQSGKLHWLGSCCRESFTEEHLEEARIQVSHHIVPPTNQTTLFTHSSSRAYKEPLYNGASINCTTFTIRMDARNMQRFKPSSGPLDSTNQES